MPSGFPIKTYVFIALVAVVLLVALILIPGPYLGLRFAPGIPFKVIGPPVLIQGEEAIIAWDSSPENARKYPSEKIEVCPFRFVFVGCVTLNADTPNDGEARVYTPSTVVPGQYHVRLTARDQVGKLLTFKTAVRAVEVRKASILSPGDKLRAWWDHDAYKQYPHVKIEFCTIEQTCYVLSYKVPNTGKSPTLTVPESVRPVSGAIRVRARESTGHLALQRIGSEVHLVELPAAIIGSLQHIADGRGGDRSGFDPLEDQQEEDNEPEGGGTDPITDDGDDQDDDGQDEDQDGDQEQTDDNCIEDESVVRALTANGIFSETNRHRQKRGLQPLRRDPKLTRAAEAKRDDMFANQYIAHTSPDGRHPYDFIRDAGYSFSYWGENLAGGTFAGDVDLVRRWVCSPSHAENIFRERFEDIGVAVGEGIFKGRRVWFAVQMFGDPKSPSPSPSPTGTPSPSPPPGGTAAFPGAQGYGATATGGRGGRVIAVTNLNDSGPGSLRAAVEATGPRIIVFRVGGTITLRSELNIANPNITIAGQTAPGDGITLRYAGSSQNLVRIRTNNVIIRYVRFRAGESSRNGDSVHVHDGSSNVIIDHSSITWAMDENLDIYSYQGGSINNVTVQNSIIAQALNTGNGSAMGALVSGLKSPEHWRLVSRVDLHHNVLANNTHRNPRVVSKGTKFVNNMVYNWLSRAGSTERDTIIDYIGNYFLRGPMSNTSNERLLFHGTTSSDLGTTFADASIYIARNIAPDFGFTNPSQDNWSMIKDHYRKDRSGRRIGIPTRMRRSTPLSGAQIPITFTDPGTSLMSSLLADVGASKKLQCNGSFTSARDPIDTRIVNHVRNRTGPTANSLPSTAAQASGGYIPPSSTAACPDTDSDGMSDQWEQANGFNQNDASDGPQDADSDGWTNVEEYLNGTNPRGQVTPTQPPPPPDGLEGNLTVAGILAETNRQRALNGLSPLTTNALLVRAAENKKDDMFEKQYISLTSPDGKRAPDFIREVGYAFDYWGENIAGGVTFKDDVDLVSRFMNNPPNRANILNTRFEEVGVVADTGTMSGRTIWLVDMMFADPK